MCVYASDQALEKVRLEAHVLDILSCHQALVPWKRDNNGGSLEWVTVRSSLPLEQRVLHVRTPPNSGVSRFTAFTRSCKARLLQDVKNLPTRAPDQGIDRTNVSVYQDEPSQTVLIVYAPTASTQLEFVSLALSTSSL